MTEDLYYEFEIKRLSTAASIEEQFDYDVPPDKDGQRPSRLQWDGAYWNMDEIQMLQSQEWINKNAGYFGDTAYVKIDVDDNTCDGDGIWLRFSGPDSENAFFGVSFTLPQLKVLAEALNSLIRFRSIEKNNAKEERTR